MVLVSTDTWADGVAGCGLYKHCKCTFYKVVTEKELTENVLSAPLDCPSSVSSTSRSLAACSMSSPNASSIESISESMGPGVFQPFEFDQHSSDSFKKWRMPKEHNNSPTQHRIRNMPKAMTSMSSGVCIGNSVKCHTEVICKRDNLQLFLHGLEDSRLALFYTNKRVLLTGRRVSNGLLCPFNYMVLFVGHNHVCAHTSRRVTKTLASPLSVEYAAECPHYMI